MYIKMMAGPCVQNATLPALQVIRSTFDMSFCKVAFLKTDEFEAFATLSSICKVQGWGQGSKG